MQVSVVGSFCSANLPDDISLFLVNGICIDPRNTTPMEMDAYSLYLALKAIELSTGASLAATRHALVDAVVNRALACNGFWSHGSWTGSSSEVHMRFTAAAIRLLVEAESDGHRIPEGLIGATISRHLTFSDPLLTGTWYLHDSFEVEGSEPHPHGPTSNAAYGSSAKNCMVLNTHVDTLVTLLDVLARARISADERKTLLTSLVNGLAALKCVLKGAETAPYSLFATIDSAIRARLFRTFSSKSHIHRIMRKGILKGYFPLRKQVRARLHAFVFPDGYTERDISLLGTGFEYHLVNLYDLSRLLCQMKWFNSISDADLMQSCKTIIDQGLDYAILSPYWDFILSERAKNTRSILLCEIIAARLAVGDDCHVPAHWIEAYCAIRKSLPPSAALIGYDPVLTKRATKRNAFESTDEIVFRNGRRLIIKFDSKEYTIDQTVPPIEQADLKGADGP